MNAMLWTPLSVPVVMGLLFRKTPKWTSWTSVLLVSGTCYACKFGIDYQAWASFFGWDNLTRNEMSDLVVSVVAMVAISVGLFYYVLCSRLYTRFPLKNKDTERVDAFFKDIETPVLAESNEHKHTDSMQYRNLGAICMAYGGVLFLGFILPNDLTGRICFIICGMFIGGIGGILYRNYLKLRNNNLSG